ncbi:exodeoxyribonuclease VII large subunit [Chryseobacterium sediminis]|jgi:exonuclease VII large subunit|uniref:exodeoxyribonuclease VII large subunit n=1 Tax=Chryseobacterium sediminis TaxID=1679494 RepID=UPI00286310F7|nr:exodeoxyribonuclease VII large subunit [Chryseobacterium sediminis]MDR6461596.1 exonuclease VII large subunit [Chryseobacterium sediminis]
MQGNEPTYQIYSPGSVLGLFSNALKLNATVNLIYLKGRYSFGGGKAYGNYYYDNLFSESDTISIGVRVSALLRSKIENNEIYTLRGYIEKSIKNSSVELRFVVDEIIQQEERAISEEELQRYELIQKKLGKGSKDLETVIRDKILKDEPVRIANIYGNNAIVQRDFAEGLDVSQKYFQISEYTCSITSSTSIASKLEEVSALGYDIIALVRGGGDRQSMETFNDLQLSELFITLEAVTVTAIGHTVDETLLDKLADKRFHLPHDYGAGLHSIVEKLSHEKSNSRALLIDEVKKDVGKQFAEQVLTLEKQLKTKNDEFTEAQKTFKEQSENQVKTFTEQLKVRNEEVEKLKKDLTEKHGEQVKTLTEQLSKRTEEFQKLQESSAKQLQEMQKSFTEQQKLRQQEMESYKKELNVLHEKNLQSVINEKIASLKAAMESLQQENVRLNTEVNNSKTDYIKIVIAAAVALVTGFLLAKIF